MKKTILAIAIPALFASAANAAVIYDQDGVNLALEGAAKVQFKGDKEKSGDTGYLNVADGDFGFGLTYDLGQNYKVGGKVSYGLDKSAADVSNNLYLNRKDLYVGFMGDFGTLTFGRQVVVLDDLGISKDKEFGIQGAKDQVGGIRADQVVKYALDTGMFYGAISHALNEDGTNKNDFNMTDGKLGFRTGGFDGRVFYGQVNDTDEKNSIWALELEYAFDAFSIAGGYYDADTELAGVNGGAKSFALAADYTMNAWTFAAGWGQINPDGGDKGNDYYINADYAFSGNVNAFAELGFGDGDDMRTGYVLGMSASF